ncbi:MAG: nucleoside hydrolase [Lachnospiraceae bacterium]|nr:nucleoside hydrolase [Lachnospiraceae bacterium]
MKDRHLRIITLLLIPPLAVLIIILICLLKEPALTPFRGEEEEERISIAEASPEASPVPTEIPEDEDEEEEEQIAEAPTPRSFVPTPTSQYTPTPTQPPSGDATPTPRAKLTPRAPILKPPEDFVPQKEESPEEVSVYGTDEDSRAIKNIILDMDYSSDVDDVAALRVATSLQRRGRIRLLAVMASVEGDEVCKAMHGHLCHDNLGGIPVGRCMINVPSNSLFWETFIERFYEEENYREYQSLDLYKEKLRECARRGERARIIVTGFLVNIECLLQDEEGYQLVKDNVDSIWFVGGAYPLKGKDYNIWYTRETIDAARYVVDNCPVKMVFSTDATSGEGNDHTGGDMVRCGTDLARQEGAADDPVNIAFRCFEKASEEEMEDGHTAWDPMCVWAACLTRRECNVRLDPVNVQIFEDGYNLYVPTPNEMRKIISRTSDDFDWYGAWIDQLIYEGIRPPRTE